MKKVYRHYTLWEDWKNGMYEDKDDQELVRRAIVLLSTPKLLLLAMQKVTSVWTVSTEVNLSNRSRNRQAWMGQSACSLIYTVPENLTKEAWRSLTEDERTEANKIADQVIEEWEKEYLKGK